MIPSLAAQNVRSRGFSAQNGTRQTIERNEVTQGQFLNFVRVAAQSLNCVKSQPFVRPEENRLRASAGDAGMQLVRQHGVDNNLCAFRASDVDQPGKVLG